MESNTVALPAPPPPGQRLLFSQEIEERVTADEDRAGRYTAERFQDRRPAAYQAAVELLGTGMGLLKIARYLGCHHLTIAAVRDREPEAVDIASQRMIGDLGTAILLQLERLMENPGLVPMTHVGMLIDQLMRQRELLAGRPTARVERYERIDVHGTWEELLQTFVSEKELPAEMVREIGSSIGFEPGENPPIGGDAPPAGSQAGADRESDGPTREAQPDLTTNLASGAPAVPSRIEPAGAAESDAQRGRGGSSARATAAGGDSTGPSEILQP